MLSYSVDKPLEMPFNSQPICIVVFAWFNTGFADSCAQTFEFNLGMFIMFSFFSAPLSDADD